MSTSQKKPHRELGLLTATTLVMGNMIGCGVYLLPIALSKFGSLSILGWAASSVGIVFLGLVFARLSQLLPQQGGLFAYTRDGFGDFAAFNVAWLYWCIVWLGNAGIMVGFLSYSQIFVPAMASNPALKFSVAMVVLWGLTYINWRGVGLAGLVQGVSLVLKIAPIILIILFGVFYFNPDYLTPFNLTDEPSLVAVGSAASMALWAFIGVESASIPARYVKNPARNIPLATLWGVGLSCCLYIIAAIVLVGIVPNAELQASTAPYATAAQKIFGSYSGIMISFVAIGALASMLGGLNGWVLLQAQMPYSASSCGLFPRFFSKLSNNETPTYGLTISSALTSLITAWYCFWPDENVLELIIKFTGFGVLTCYLFTTVAGILLRKHHTPDHTIGWFDGVLTAVTTVYLVWALMSVDATARAVGLHIFLFTSLTYALVKLRHKT